MSYTPRLKEKYSKDIVKNLQERFSYKSPMQVPRLTKICVNQGVGDAVTDKKLIEYAMTEMSNITGQKAVPTKSKKDISNFKLRKDVAIGVRVTLRDEMMYEFLDRLISVALPRIRDFKGVNNKGFDGNGNYIGWTVVTSEVSLSDDANEYTGSGVAQFFDPAGNPVGGSCPTFTGTRFTGES